MLGKMLIHALVAAVLIGSAAAVYAGTREGGFPSLAVSDENHDDHDD